VLQCVAVYCSVAGYLKAVMEMYFKTRRGLLQRVVVCCSVAVRCSVAGCLGAGTERYFKVDKVCCSVLHCVALCCSVLQCVAVWQDISQQAWRCILKSTR